MKSKIRLMSVLGMMLAAGIVGASPSTAVAGDRKEFNLGLLGKIVLLSESEVDIQQPIEINTYKVKSSFILQHELDDVRVPTLAKIDIKGSILEDDSLARLEVTTEGLLLKGVPEYISQSQKAQDEFAKNGIKFTAKSDDNNKIIFVKDISVPPEKRNLFDEMKSIDKKIRDYKQQVAISISVSDSTREAELRKLIGNAVDRKKDLFGQLFNSVSASEFACAPEFSREFTFPIWGVGGSVEGGGASAAARAGVSGDVKIKIEPICGISAASLFQVETWAKAKIGITSSGYFGANASAEAAGGYGMKFSGKYGDYFIPPEEIRLNEQERQFFNDIVLKMMKEAENSQQALVAFTNKISRSIEEITGKIQMELISKLQNQQQICSFLQHVEGSNSEAWRICQVVASGLGNRPELIIPDFIQPRMPPLPSRPDGRCRAQLPLPYCRVVEAIWGRCCTRRVRGICIGPYPCLESSEEEIPPGCRAAQEAVRNTNAEYRRICERIRRWEQEVAGIRARYNEAVARAQRQWRRNRDQLTAEYNRRMAEYNSQSAQLAEYSRRLPGMVQEAVTNKILRQVNTKDVAKKLLAAAWQVKEWVDLTNNFVTDKLPQNLTFNVRGAASVNFNATAHILHVTPRLRTVSSFSPQRNDFSITLYGVEDERAAGEGGIGGLDILDCSLSVRLNGSFTGREFDFGTTETGKILPFFGEGRIRLSNEEKQLYQWSTPR